MMQGKGGNPRLSHQCCFLINLRNLIREPSPHSWAGGAANSKMSVCCWKELSFYGAWDSGPLDKDSGLSIKKPLNQI